jgi:serine protease inhibitor
MRAGATFLRFLHHDKKRIMKSQLFFLLLVPVIFSCNKENGNDPILEPQTIMVSKTTSDIIQADNTFGITLFQQVLNHDTTTANVFVSPTSAALALAMTYNGAEGDTRTAMETALHKGGLTSEEINTSYQTLIRALISVDPKVTLSVANSIWYRQQMTLLPDFVNANKTYYDAEVRALDFDDPGTPAVINQWVSEQTHGKIKKIVDQIDPDVVMDLINAIYFKGAWKYAFKTGETLDLPFTRNNGSEISTPMMHQSISLGYRSNDLFSLVELPYGRGNFSMVVMLPLNGHTPQDIADALTSDNWNSWTSDLDTISLELYLPKFKFSYKKTLNDDLTAMGMGVAFSDFADFSGINGVGNLKISEVLQKTFVEVNEEGTEAAAVTSVTIVNTSYPGHPMIFRVDRPFLFAIREVTTGTILFIGEVQDPSQKGEE